MSNAIKDTADRVIANTYARYPLAIERGDGCRLFDDQGRAYTDFIAGIAVCNLGHAHPRLVSALTTQAGKLWHTSNLFYTVPQMELAAWLTQNSFADRVFFANSGAEANEAAIKLARKYFNNQGERGRFRVVCMRQSFHGRTMATLSATGQEKIRRGFDPVLEGFDFVPFNDIEALGSAVDKGTCAVMLEPIQGEGGVICPDPDYLHRVRRACDSAGCLMILDEVQTGIGRTGKLFAYEHYDVKPDIMTLAKALGNGLPIGAMLASEAVASAFAPGSHASTFGGTPIVTHVALEVLKCLAEEDILTRVGEIGAYFQDRLTDLQTRQSVIEDVRGKGLLIGVQLSIPGTAVVKACMQRGFLINCVQDRVLRLAPPLIISRAEIDAFVRCLEEVLTEVA